MVRTVIQFNLAVNYLEACEYAAFHSAPDTCVNSRDILLGDRAADYLVYELVACTALVGVYIDLNVTILTLTTRLLSILVVNVSFLSDSFLIRNLRSTNICFYLELSQQSVNDDLQMELTHTCDNGLACFFRSIGSEGRVFFSQLSQRDTHLLLTCLSLRLDSQLDNRLREFHGFQYNRVLLIAESITCCSILKTDSSTDITCIDGVDVLSVVGVHLNDTAYSLVLILCGVINGRTSGQHT